MEANANSGKQPALMAGITNDEIRELVAHGYVDGDTAWDAIYNDHVSLGLQARERCVNVRDALRIDAEDIEIVNVEACS